MRRGVCYAIVLVGLLSVGSASAGTSPVLPAGTHEQALCGAAGPGFARCFAVGYVDGAGAPAAIAAPAGSAARVHVDGAPADEVAMTPAVLHTAYSLPTTTSGSGSQTIGIVDAFDDPTVESDLGIFDSQFGLPACTTANGCFRKVDQTGGTNYPPSNSGWEVEIALDVEAAHAICQNCKILLVEANDNNDANLAAAVNEAVSLGATVVSNSYGGPESDLNQPSFAAFASSYRHPGIPIVASAGDGGWGANFPADVNTVVSVGGTTLSTNPSTGAYEGESVWFNAGTGQGTGSGCSVFDTAEPWQTAASGWSATGCGTARGIADVSADADPQTGLLVWQNGTEFLVGGTSLSAPLIAGTYALAANAAATTANPVSVPYAHAASLHDVTSGTNTSSACPTTICHAAAGYDGPTGLGTPNGLAGFINPTAPTSTALPTVSGTPTQGQTLTGTHGSWTGSPTSYAEQWLRCNSGGTGCTAISGANALSYTLVLADVGGTIELRVTATNSAGSTSATSATTAVVAGLAPANTSLPTVTGGAVVGSTLTGATGSWSGSPTSYAEQWLRCNGGCSPISGATTLQYLVQHGDVGARLELQVTATNAFGSTNATSATTAVVPGAAPANSARPTVSGAAVVGGTLTGSTGTWSGDGSISFAEQWLRCNGTCAPIAGATSVYYVAQQADAGDTLELRVTATSVWGTNNATSAQTAVVPAAAPVGTSPPVVSGTPAVGQMLTGTYGGWVGAVPLAKAVQWLRCDASGNNCVAITGARSLSYSVQNMDVGHTLALQVTGTNAYGTATATSAATAVVGAEPPANVVAPSISGSAVVGQPLTATTGTWSGTAPISFLKQWLRCNAGGGACVAIAGAMQSAYTVQAADVGQTLRFRVTARNAWGSGVVATSAATAVVTG